MPPAGPEQCAAHVASHRSLLRTSWFDFERAPRLDAIVVPAFRRPDGYVDKAAAIAEELGSALVLLCSGPADPEVVRKELEQSGRHLEHAIVCLPFGYRLPKLDLETDRYDETLNYQLHDAHLKRNVALALGRQLGWNRLLFLNDDMVRISADQVRRAVAPLAERDVRAAGYAFDWFPDNSVVCHARRLAELEQETFISDAVLAVELGPDVPFFPNVYNEDWMFLAPLVREGGVVLVGDEIEQLPYDPYAHPGRAAVEEFGDTLAEALMVALDDGDGPEQLNTRFWEGAVRSRLDMVTELEEQLLPSARKEGPGSDAARAVRCLRRARQSHHGNWAAQLSRWTASWQRDRASWARYLEELPKTTSLEDALRRLGLAERQLAGVAGQSGVFGRRPQSDRVKRSS